MLSLYGTVLEGQGPLDEHESKPRTADLPLGRAVARHSGKLSEIREHSVLIRQWPPVLIGRSGLCLIISGDNVHYRKRFSGLLCAARSLSMSRIGTIRE